MQDIRSEYDLGGNPTTVYFYDNVGKAYKETRTYAKGYQITGSSFSETGSGVAVSTTGSYTYDTNNNLTGTMKADATRSGSQLSYRAQWTFTFDRKNRLQTSRKTMCPDTPINRYTDKYARRADEPINR